MLAVMKWVVCVSVWGGGGVDIVICHQKDKSI